MTCSTLSDCINVNPVGIRDIKQSTTELFPNPTHGIFQLSIDEEIRDVKVFNLLGAQMKVTVDLSNKVIDATKLSVGSYQVVVQSDDYTYSSHLIIRR